MRATMMHSAGDVRVENVADPKIVEPTDAIMRIVRACICGSDLWPYKDKPKGEKPASMGHEAIGIVEDVGRDVTKVKRGQIVIMPFALSDGTCQFCQEGLHTACERLTFTGNAGFNGAQAEAMRIVNADGSLFPIDVTESDARLPGLLTLSDVMGTGHHAAVVARVKKGSRVAVVGDGAVGLCGVIAAKRLGAEQIIVLGRHTARTDLAKAFGATDIVAERGPGAVEKVKKLSGGFGVHSVLECVGTDEATAMSIEIARPGGAVGRVGVPHYDAVPHAGPLFFKNVIVGGGPAPVRAYIAELLPDVLEGRIEPGRVFDVSVGLDGVPDGYRSMNERKALKVLVTP